MYLKMFKEVQCGCSLCDILSMKCLWIMNILQLPTTIYSSTVLPTLSVSQAKAPSCWHHCCMEIYTDIIAS